MCEVWVYNIFYILQKRILFATILNMQKKRPARQGEAHAGATSASLTDCLPQDPPNLHRPLPGACGLYPLLVPKKTRKHSGFSSTETFTWETAWHGIHRLHTPHLKRRKRKASPKRCSIAVINQTMWFSFFLLIPLWFFLSHNPSFKHLSS